MLVKDITKKKKTVGITRQSSKGKWEEKTKHQLEKERMYGCQQKEITNGTYQNQVITTLQFRQKQTRQIEEKNGLTQSLSKLKDHSQIFRYWPTSEGSLSGEQPLYEHTHFITICD